MVKTEENFTSETIQYIIEIYISCHREQHIFTTRLVTGENMRSIFKIQ